MSSYGEGDFQYALECSVKGKNPDIKGSIKIVVIGIPPPPDVSDVGTTHAGISSGSSLASGNFRVEFVIEDVGEHDAAVELTAKAVNNKNRTAEKFTLTRYTLHGEEVVKDTVIEFNKHYIKIPDGGMDTSSAKKHKFAIESSEPRSEVQHMSFKADAATKLKTTQNVVTKLMVDQRGSGIIQPG